MEEEDIYLENRNLLNGKELVQCRIDEPNLVLPVRGQKETVRNGTTEERERLAKLYADMKFFISLERVDRQCNRSRGIWHPETNSIEVISQEGNWNIFGYVKNHVQYLKPYEGLYLMEINRLELYYNSVIVSIEQGYQILLNTSGSLALQHYNVYAKLMRNGYIVFRSPECQAINVENSTDSDYIWIYLNELLTKSSNSKFNTDEKYTDVKNSMNAIMEVTKNAVFKEDNSEDVFGWHETKQKPPNKRKLETSIYPETKKCKHDLIEDCPQKFKNIFKEIDFIKLTKSNCELTECNIEFTFNLYLPNRKYFKKSNLDRPDYRIIVWDDDTTVPSKLQLETIYFKQTYRAPIIVVFISKFFNFNAYFYYFS